MIPIHPCPAQKTPPIEPAPIVITTSLAFVLFSGGYDEFVVRFPFALASVIAGLMRFLPFIGNYIALAPPLLLAVAAAWRACV